ncbi:MAG TPA: hypothetical protein VLF95_04420, partial [Vicinamibacteria bacterium]|nr:hypothetical protein [Vicinamibacteria bacterium]
REQGDLAEVHENGEDAGDPDAARREERGQDGPAYQREDGAGSGERCVLTLPRSCQGGVGWII